MRFLEVPGEENKMNITDKIIEAGLVAVVRAKDGDEALKIVEALKQGGVKAIEITYTVPGATAVIERLAKEYKGTDMIIGAGTVLDAETARIAILAGSQFIVSPYLNPDVVKLCNRYQVPAMPGAMTIKEVVEAMECGASIVKVFPGDVVGVSFIKAVMGPLPYAKLMPTGGVDINNVGEWIKAGCVAIGAGSNLTAGAKTGDFEKITTSAKEFIAKINEARNKL